MMGKSPRCYIQSFVEFGPLVPKKIFEGFLPYMGVLPKEAPHLALIGKRFWRRCLSTVGDDGRTDAGPLVYYKLTYELSVQVS